MSFRSPVSEENGQYVGQWQELDEQALPAGDIPYRVHYSSLNYKDALSASGHKGVTKAYPHTPGIDAAGTPVYLKAQPISRRQWGGGVWALGMNTARRHLQVLVRTAVGAALKPQTLSMADSMAQDGGFTARFLCKSCLLWSGSRKRRGGGHGCNRWCWLGGGGTLASSALRCWR